MLYLELLNVEPNARAALLQRQPDHLRRILRAHRIELVLIQAERFHIAAH